MKLGKRALLIATLVVLTSSGLSLAQESVSLLGYDAQRTSNRAQIDFHTTGPVYFIVDRFTMGEWIDVWSEGFTASQGVGEIQLEYNRPDLDDLVTGISLNGERHRTSLRIYLGPNADREAVWLTNDGSTSSLYIPQLAPEVHLDTQPELMPAQPIEEPVALESDSAELREPEPATLIDPSLAEGVATEHQAAEPEIVDIKVALEPVWPVDIVPELQEEPVIADMPVAGANGSELNVPRTDEPAEEVDAEPAAIDVAPAELAPIDPVEISEPEPDELVPLFDRSEGIPPFRITNLPGDEPAYLTNPSSFADQGPVTQGGEINAQGLPPQAPPDEVELQDATDEVGEALSDLLNEMLGIEAQTDEVDTALPSGITTAGTSYNTAQPAALISTTNGGIGTGKDALSNIRIELLNVLGTPLDQALTLLIEPTEYNVIVDASVGSNAVSLSFKDAQTDLKSALDLITRTYGLDYVVESGTIVVAAAEKVNGQLIQHEYRVFTLSYANPKSVMQALVTTALVSEEEIEIYPGETEYTTVNGSTALSESTGGTEVTVKEIQSDLSTTPPNSILVKAVPERMAQIAEIISRLDRRPKIIDLEVRVCEANNDAMENFGIEWNTDPVGQSFTGQTWFEQRNENDAIEAFTQGSFNRTGFNFTALINHEIEIGNVTLLAQPTLNTVENRQAIYFAGEKVPYVREISIDETGQTKFTVDYINLGVTLNFKPRMDADGQITVDVNPIVSSLLEFIEFPSGLQAPRTQERQLATTVRVADCEPFILAGLINDTERETLSKVPVLGDLPLLGKLFRNKKTEGNRTEIIIVVIPHIRE